MTLQTLLRSKFTILPVSRSRSKLFKSRYRNHIDHTTFPTGEGSIVVFHKKSRLPSVDAPGKDDPESTVLESFSATIDYLPNGSFPKSKISVAFEQFISFRDATSRNPVLSFCAMIPDDAEILYLISEDDVHGVQRMIEQGRASLSDCDSMGRSLLFVRCISAKDWRLDSLISDSMLSALADPMFASFWLPTDWKSTPSTLTSSLT